MRRASIALVGGLLIAALLPGSALATPIAGSLDQSNTARTQKAAAGSQNPTTGNWFIQTFTAGKTGILTAVALWETDQDTIAVSIYPMVAGKPDISGYWIGNGLGNATDMAGWVYFSMDYAPPVIAGTQYAIAIFIPDSGTDHEFFGSGDTYPGGEAFAQTGPGTLGPVSATLKDFAFQTYVDPQTTTLTWSKTQMTAGVPTQLTLDETFVFPTYGLESGAEPALGPPGLEAIPTINVEETPAWFVATTIECSAQIAPADCKLSNEAPGPGFSVAPDGNPVTIKLRGLASPTAADTGSFPAAARGCMGYVGLVELASCVEGRASVVVVGPGPTPPPTTASAPPSKDSGLPLLLVACFGAAACGMVLTIGRRARRFS